MKLTRLLTALWLAIGFAGAAQASCKVLWDSASVAPHYKDTTLQGWRIHLSPSLLEHHMLASRATNVLNTELTSISQRIPPAAIAELKDVPIWVEYHTATRKVLHYWASAKKLKEFGLDGTMEGALDISAPDYVNMPPDSLPLVKWFAMAYMQTALGMNNPEIARTYQHAKASGAYDVQVHSRQYFPFASRAEYFTVLSVAYFTGRLSYAPYNKVRLKEMDPPGYEMIEKLWKIK